MAVNPAPTWPELARRVATASTDSFIELIHLARLDPGRDLRFADWTGVNFAGCDLSECDFSGARLHKCKFEGAKLVGKNSIARFDKAELNGSNLRECIDWAQYLSEWRRLNIPITDHHLPAGTTFHDAPFAPELVVVPPGRFMMGSQSGSGLPSEHPQHSVTISYRLAVGRFPITFEEWQFAQRRGGVDRPLSDSYRRPVVGVSWFDAVAYCAWLTKETREQYRLLSESEWEYVCRAGTATEYFTGDEIETNQARFGKQRGAQRADASEVGSFPPNAWGLYDMHGNVLEWCQDEWHKNYEGAPENGSPWESGTRRDAQDGLFKRIQEFFSKQEPPTDNLRVVRGGAWYDRAEHLRSAYRVQFWADSTYLSIGFRVVRSLSP